MSHIQCFDPRELVTFGLAGSGMVVYKNVVSAQPFLWKCDLAGMGIDMTYEHSCMHTHIRMFN